MWRRVVLPLPASRRSPLSSGLTAAVVALGSLIPATLRAQAPLDPLGNIVAEALHNNLGLAQQDLTLARSGADVREARGRFFPSLSLESRFSEQSGTLNLGDFVNPANAALNGLTGSSQFPTDLDITLPYRHQSSLHLVQPLFNPAIIAGYAASRHAYEAQELSRAGAARRLAADVQAAYLNVAAARSARRTLETTLVLVDENRRVSQRLVEAGRATPDVALRARAEQSDVEQQLLEARELENAASRAFNQLLRRPLDSTVEVVPDSLLRFEFELTEQEAVESALSNREELDGTTAGIHAAEANVRLANASFLPSVAIAVDYGFQGSDLSFRTSQDYAVVSLVVSWNVFNGGRDLARRQAAHADVERLELRRTELEDQIRLDVRQAYGAMVVARDAIATADDRLAAARRTFELVRRRYEEALASQVEFLDARTALTNAELNRVRTVYRYAIRYVDLERAAALRTLSGN